MSYNILRVKDSLDKLSVNKGLLFSLPMRLCIIAKSGLGKSNLLVNLICRDMYYKKNFSGDNIFIISVSLQTDDKLKALVNIKNVPDENLFHEYNEEDINTLYSYLEDLYKNGDKSPKLIIFDDCAFQGDMRGDNKNSALNRLYLNGRHINVSTIIISQSYFLVGKNIRLNANGYILFSRLPEKEIKQICDEHNYLDDKRDFLNLYKKATGEKKNNFFVINYTNDNDKIYQDSNFKPMKVNG